MIRGPDPEQMGEVPRLLTDIVDQQPGIHFRELKREAELSSNGQLRHHLDRLKREGMIVEIKDGGFKRFFIAGEHDPEVRRGLARFARRVPRLIAKLLLRQPLNRTQLRRRLDCADSTLGYHLNRMIELGDLERDRRGNCCLYSLREPEFVRRVLHHLGEPVPGPTPDREQPAEEHIAEAFFERYGPGWSLRTKPPASPGPATANDGRGAVGARPHGRHGASAEEVREDAEVREWPHPG